MAKNMYQKRAERKAKALDENSNKRGLQKNVINWYPGHMAKTKREIKEVLPLIDVIYEVVDARMPKSSKLKEVDDIIQNKKKIMIMTKYDLCDEKETKKFVTYYENIGYKVICTSLLNSQNVKDIILVTKDILKEENIKRKNKGLKEKTIKALVIGAPNVGKSTLINRMSLSKKTVVGNKPGVTKKLNFINVSKDILLLDTPGILWPKMTDSFEAHVLASLSSIKEEILDKDDIALFILKTMIGLYPSAILKRYGINSISDILDTYEVIGKKRGALLKGNQIDYEKVSSLIIRDLQNGYFGKITLDRL